MPLQPISNPPNPWLSTSVEYLEEIPPARLEVYEDHTREILATNDSPDVGFTWSVNPYRGCLHACAYCLSGGTPILFGDGAIRPLQEVRLGDVLYGTVRDGRERRCVATEVTAVWRTTRPAFRVMLKDGGEIVASADHRFLTASGWRSVGGEGPSTVPLTTNDSLVGFSSPSDARKAVAIASIEPMGVTLPMFDITTGTRDFIANGVVSHNCYARPNLEYLGLGAGTDFERRITVKPEAPKLLREAFERRSWKGELIAFSGVTDCYQPLEASYQLTRGCLEVCRDYRNPVAIITKAPLVERDIDLLVELSQVARASVTVSIPLWDRDHARALEPQVAAPQRRMETVARLAAAGIETGVNVAPMIPGLGDADIPAILEAAAKAGAKWAGFVFLRLPGSVAAVFEERLREQLPLRADRVLSRIREARGGKLYDSRFGVRGRGQGTYAETVRNLFDSTARRVGIPTGFTGSGEPASTFRRPDRPGRQLPLL